MVNWVEKGKAPDILQASRAVNGQVVRSRPLCPYPQEARYSGQGSVDDAANFRCVQPQGLYSEAGMGGCAAPRVVLFNRPPWRV
jgi:hypothetical protein